MIIGNFKTPIKLATASILLGLSWGGGAMAFDASSVNDMHNDLQAVQNGVSALPNRPELVLKINQLQRDIDMLRAKLNRYENKLNQAMRRPKGPAMLGKMRPPKRALPPLGKVRPLENPYASAKENDQQYGNDQNAIALSQSNPSQNENQSVNELNTVPEILRDTSLTPKVRAFAVTTVTEMAVEPEGLGTIAPDIMAFNQAKAYFEDGNYRHAERQFHQFIEYYNKSALTSNAYYWLGQTYFKRDNFKVAARVFYRGYRLNKKGAKAPDNLFQLASSLIELGNNSDACSAFYEINHRYAKSHPALSNDAKLAQKKFGC